jgi:predicted nucleic acid-binding protein
MVYLDASVALAHLLSEDTRPAERLWSESLVASRLTVYEVGTRLRALGLDREEPSIATAVLSQVALVDLVSDTIAAHVARVPAGLRTLDGLHLASALFLRDQGVDVRVATYDRRFADGARELGFELYPL